MLRVRFGIKDLEIRVLGMRFAAPNAGVFVKRNVSRDAFADLMSAALAVRVALRAMGWGDLADRIICEES